MADNPAHDPAGPQYEPSDASDTMLVGAAAPTAARAATGVIDAAPSESPAEELPVWSFPSTAGRSVAASAIDRHQVELPFMPPAEAEASTPARRSQPLLGPIGSPHSTLVVTLLAVVTLGVYALVWHQRVNRELEEFDPKLHARPTRSAIAVGVPWLVGLLVTIAGAVLIVGARLSVTLPLATHVTTTQAYLMLAGLVAVPYLTLVVPFSVVAVIMTLERLRCVEEHVGTTTDRQVRAVGTSMLLAVPVIGGLLLIGVAQRRVNAIWDAVAPAGRLSNRAASIRRRPHRRLRPLRHSRRARAARGARRLMSAPAGGAGARCRPRPSSTAWTSPMTPMAG